MRISEKITSRSFHPTQPPLGKGRSLNPLLGKEGQGRFLQKVCLLIVCVILSKLSQYVLLFLLCAGALAHTVSAEVEKIIVYHGVDKDRLKRLLDMTIEDYGPFELVKSIDMEEGRAVQSLQDNTLINFISFPTNIERERTLLPIMLPIRNELLGYRICLIKKGTQAKFTGIRSLEDWQKRGLKIGTVTHWSDTPVLEANNIKLAKVAKDEVLFDMLDAERFDCFSRGITQIKANLVANADKEVEMEQNLLLFYPFRSMYFVSKKNPQLAKRITEGYQRAVQNGTWDAVLQEDRKDILQKIDGLNLKQRTVIALSNPFMSEQAKALPSHFRDLLK